MRAAWTQGDPDKYYGGLRKSLGFVGSHKLNERDRSAITLDVNKVYMFCVYVLGEGVCSIYKQRRWKTHTKTI